MVELNIQALMHMSHVIMPQMVAKGRGLVINLSSSSAIRNTVMLAVYGSTKVSNDLNCYSRLSLIQPPLGQCSLAGVHSEVVAFLKIAAAKKRPYLEWLILRFCLEDIIMVQFHPSTHTHTHTPHPPHTSTQSFVEFFSTSLSLEYASKGIIVQVIIFCLCCEVCRIIWVMFFSQTVSPFFVATAMSGIRRSNLFVADANQYARSALATVGIMSFTHGTLSHSIQVKNSLSHNIFGDLNWLANGYGRIYF